MGSLSSSESYYLSCILLAIESNERLAPFDMLFRRWWTASKPALETPIDHPDWAFTPCAASPHRLDFISNEAAALRAIQSNSECQIVPAIPDRSLRDLLFKGRVRSPAELRLLLHRWCRFGAVSRIELDRLRAHRVHGAMPDGWNDEQSMFARFSVAGISIQEVGIADLRTLWADRPRGLKRNLLRGPHALLTSATWPEIAR